MKVLVTGGGGFLGSALVRRLLARGDEVTVVARGSYPALVAAGATVRSVDIQALDALGPVFEGQALVFHVAAKAGVWGAAADFEGANVKGTQNVIEACRRAGVPRLVHTSSPSVVFDGHDHLDAGNDLPYPASYEAHYPRTKAEAERAVLAANSPSLATVALRPHLIYGPGDPWLLPRILARHRAGRLRIVGDGENLVSLTFVENAAEAHVAAASALVDHASPCAGRPYFVNDATPVKVWSWLNDVFAGLGLPRLERRVSRGLARAAGSVAETLWTWLPLSGEPPMTRFVADQLATSHTYDLGPARRDLGYAPAVDGETALARTIDALRAG